MAANSAASRAATRRTNPALTQTAGLFRKGKTASELRFMGHTLMENRNGLIVNAMVTQADGHAEREAAKAMVADVRQANRKVRSRWAPTRATTRPSSSRRCGT